jgi:hypothetical protein
MDGWSGRCGRKCLRAVGERSLRFFAGQLRGLARDAACDFHCGENKERETGFPRAKCA